MRCMNPCHPGLGCLNKSDENQSKSKCLLASSALTGRFTVSYWR